MFHLPNGFFNVAIIIPSMCCELALWRAVSKLEDGSLNHMLFFLQRTMAQRASPIGLGVPSKIPTSPERYDDMESRPLWPCLWSKPWKCWAILQPISAKNVDASFGLESLTPEIGAPGIIVCLPVHDLVLGSNPLQKTTKVSWNRHPRSFWASSRWRRWIISWTPKYIAGCSGYPQYW